MVSNVGKNQGIDLRGNDVIVLVTSVRASNGLD